jgi:hypothetical protein
MFRTHIVQSSQQETVHCERIDLADPQFSNQAAGDKWLRLSAVLYMQQRTWHARSATGGADGTTGRQRRCHPCGMLLDA